MPVILYILTRKTNCGITMYKLMLYCICFLQEQFLQKYLIPFYIGIVCLILHYRRCRSYQKVLIIQKYYNSPIIFLGSVFIFFGILYFYYRVLQITDQHKNILGTKYQVPQIYLKYNIHVLILKYHTVLQLQHQSLCFYTVFVILKITKSILLQARTIFNFTTDKIC